MAVKRPKCSNFARSVDLMSMNQDLINQPTQRFQQVQYYLIIYPSVDINIEKYRPNIV